MKYPVLALVVCLACPLLTAQSIGMRLEASRLPSALPKNVQQQVATILTDSAGLIAKKEYRKAVESAVKAFEVVPEPQEKHKEMVEILAIIGEANFQAKAFEQARRALSDAMHFPGALGDPWLHLRLGQSQLELGNHERAKDELARAAMGGGKEIFTSEDPKYWKYVTTFLKPPPGGW
jgi:tetratricopeptide (TPR) repeat protein